MADQQRSSKVVEEGPSSEGYADESSKKTYLNAASLIQRLDEIAEKKLMPSLEQFLHQCEHIRQLISVLAVKDSGDVPLCDALCEYIMTLLQG